LLACCALRLLRGYVTSLPYLLSGNAELGDIIQGTMLVVSKGTLSMKYIEY
jgi:hypothetical protein